MNRNDLLNDMPLISSYALRSAKNNDAMFCLFVEKIWNIQNKFVIDIFSKGSGCTPSGELSRILQQAAR